MNKSFLSNALAFLLVLIGYFMDNNTLFMVGLFAFSGSITNTLAIHMLFEKVPFLYGSGVVENRFEEFKVGIHSLIMNEFFTKDNLKHFFEDEMSSRKNSFDLKPILEKTDLSPAFDSLKQAVIESSFGGMLQMMGGEAVLDPLKEPFIEKLKLSIIDISQKPAFQEALKDSLKNSDLSDDMYEKVSSIVNKRLEELSPKMVKDIIQKMIKEHLGWLVVWGAILGGLIGLVSTQVLV